MVGRKVMTLRLSPRVFTLSYIVRFAPLFRTLDSSCCKDGLLILGDNSSKQPRVALRFFPFSEATPVRLYKLAANQGLAAAQNRLDDMGVNKNEALLKWYKKN